MQNGSRSMSFIHFRNQMISFARESHFHRNVQRISNSINANINRIHGSHEFHDKIR